MPIPANWAPRLLAVLRIVAGLCFLAHGVSKYFGLPPFPAPLTPLLYVAGALELAGGTALILGLFVRPVAFVLSGFMAVAYFTAHAPKSFLPLSNHGEAAILYCFVFLYFAATGAGPWSSDARNAGRAG